MSRVLQALVHASPRYQASRLAAQLWHHPLAAHIKQEASAYLPWDQIRIIP
jgi:hypothetical protein